MTSRITERLTVQKGVQKVFTDKLTAAVARLQVGEGRTPGMVLGPLVDAAAVANIEDHVAGALGGTFVEFPVLTAAKPGMLVTGEEAFGPLDALYVFEDAAEAIAQASATNFGLAAHVCARDLSRVRRVDEALDYGMQGVTAGLIPTAAAPFGGVRRPGLGREGSWHGIEDYTELKCLCLGLRGASRATRRSTAENARRVRRRRPWPSLASKEPVLGSGGFGGRAPLARRDASSMVSRSRRPARAASR
jgi:succinate-semialdehyde dehydrogenase/glutarate-semialdehyde dehydrogenase